MQFRPLHDRVVVRPAAGEGRAPAANDDNEKPAAAPRRSFSFPHELLDDPSFTADEKRSILCEWASDACAVESFPVLRWLPGTEFPVTFSAVMDALAQLDRQSLAFEEAEESESDQRSSVVYLPSRHPSRGGIAGVGAL